MVGSQPISTAGPHARRPLVEAAVALRVADLRTLFGWRRSHRLVALDGSAVRISLDVPPDATSAWLRAERWPAGSAWSTSGLDVALVSRPRHLGGRMWLARCPETGVPALALYLSADGTRLASRQALGLAHASQRQRAPARAATRAARIRAGFGGDGTRRPAGMHAATFARLSAELAALDGVAAGSP